MRSKTAIWSSIQERTSIKLNNLLMISPLQDSPTSSYALHLNLAELEFFPARFRFNISQTISPALSSSNFEFFISSFSILFVYIFVIYQLTSRRLLNYGCSFRRYNCLLSLFLMISSINTSLEHTHQRHNQYSLPLPS